MTTLLVIGWLISAPIFIYVGAFSQHATTWRPKSRSAQIFLAFGLVLIPVTAGTVQLAWPAAQNLPVAPVIIGGLSVLLTMWWRVLVCGQVPRASSLVSK